jgi:6-pyruvoyltetrahydropterin/6-carboxytetrahydropterin synthase
MYVLNVSSHFSAAHLLKGYQGDCKKMHGHTWKVRVALQCEKTDEIGLSIDFSIIKQKIKQLVDRFDHTCLNELEWFKEKNPTSENIAKVFYTELKKIFENESVKLKEVEVWESERASVAYYE